LLEIRNAVVIYSRGQTYAAELEGYPKAAMAFHLELQDLFALQAMRHAHHLEYLFIGERRTIEPGASSTNFPVVSKTCP
jgi:hypothetical protein